MTRVPDWIDLGRLAATVPAEGWWQRAACAGLTIDFFPPSSAEAEEPKAVCATCPCLYDCLADGLKEDHGVRGGTTERERRAVRRALSEEKAA